MLTVVLSLGMFIVPARVTAHPLDPLTPDEIRAVAHAARTNSRFASAQLWRSFKLRPHNSFDRSRAIDLRKDSNDR